MVCYGWHKGHTPQPGVDGAAEALHAQVATARHLIEDKEAQYVLQLKANQPTRLGKVETLGIEDLSSFRR